MRETISFKTGEFGSFRKALASPNGPLRARRARQLCRDLVRGGPQRAPVQASELPSAPSGRDPPAARHHRSAAGRRQRARGGRAAAGRPQRARDRRGAAVDRQRADQSGSSRPPASPGGEKVAAQVAAITDSFSAAAIETELGDGNTVQLSGYLGSEQILDRLRRSLGEIAGLGAVETDLEVHPLAVLRAAGRDRALSRRGARARPRPAITTSDLNTRLSEGDPLTLDIFTAARCPLPLSRLRPARRPGRLHHHDAGAGMGRGHRRDPLRDRVPDLRAVRTRDDRGGDLGRPLFDRPRPAYEPAADYIAAFRQRLAELRASDPDAPPAASHLFITTEPNPAS